MSAYKKPEYEFLGIFHSIYGLENAESMNAYFSIDRIGFFRSKLLDNNNKRYDMIGHLKTDGSESRLLFVVPFKDMKKYHILSVSKQNATYAQSPQDSTRFLGDYIGGWYVHNDFIDIALMKDYDRLKEYAASSGPMLGCVTLKLKLIDTIDKKVWK
jgi:hypothetical protein